MRLMGDVNLGCIRHRVLKALCTPHKVFLPDAERPIDQIVWENPESQVRLYNGSVTFQYDIWRNHWWPCQAYFDTHLDDKGHVLNQFTKSILRFQLYTEKIAGTCLVTQINYNNIGIRKCINKYFSVEEWIVITHTCPYFNSGLVRVESRLNVGQRWQQRCTLSMCCVLKNGGWTDIKPSCHIICISHWCDCWC